MGFVLSVLNRGIIWRESVLNSVYNFAGAAFYLVKINTLGT